MPRKVKPIEQTGLDKSMSEDKFEKIGEILREILKWTKFDGTEKVRTIMDSELDDDVKKLVYHLSDGKSSGEIEKKVTVSSQTVRNYWKRWGKKGIMEIHPDYKKRYRKIFSLEEVGIEVPDVGEEKGKSVEENEGGMNEQEEST